MILSPIIFHFCISVMRSVSNWRMGSGDAIYFTVLKYLQCWVHTVPMPLLLHGRYAETSLV
jgi:hypothetical protein